MSWNLYECRMNDNRRNISTHVDTSLSSGLLWPCLISGWQHMRLLCTSMTAGTSSRAERAARNNQRTRDQQLHRCKNRYSRLCRVLRTKWKAEREGDEEEMGERQRGKVESRVGAVLETKTFICFPRGCVLCFRAFMSEQLCVFVDSKTLF